MPKSQSWMMAVFIGFLRDFFQPMQLGQRPTLPGGPVLLKIKEARTLDDLLKLRDDVAAQGMGIMVEGHGLRQIVGGQAAPAGSQAEVHVLIIKEKAGVHAAQ